MVRLFVLLTLCATLAAPARAQSLLRDRDYDDCLRQIGQDPAAAFDASNSWAERGGGSRARHCGALALLKMEQYDQAAMRLEQLATDMARGEGDMVPEVLSQAAQAWLLARKPARANAALTAALKLRPRDVELLIDRAVVLAEAKNYWEAIDDLNRALELDPRRADAYVLRASAYRYVDSLELATEDLSRALTLDPRNMDALAERGIVRRLTNDPNGARQDWLTVLRTAPESPAADVARNNLEKMDLK
ncbi:MAG: tetratricopeptide repeat protein [Alphaproteobacteria bacterium]|nr:tetratricopeptide repeat protein [Alphaproteobacteria bacterium]